MDIPAPTHYTYINAVDSTSQFQSPHKTSSTPHTKQDQNSHAPHLDHSQSSTPNPTFTQGKFRTLEELGLKIDNPNLSPTEVATLTKLLESNSDVFALTLHDLPGTTLVQYDIDTGDHRPIRQRCYRPTPQAREEMSRQVKELLDAKFIYPSTSPWASPTLLVKKKTGDQRMCIDYRLLNKISTQLSWLLPLLTDVIDTLAYNQPAFFSSLDMKSGYHQISMSEDASKKSAFCIPDGTYAWNRLSFGLQGAGQIFQMLMSEVMRGLTFKTLIVYVDDILVFSQLLRNTAKT